MLTTKEKGPPSERFWVNSRQADAAIYSTERERVVNSDWLVGFRAGVGLSEFAVPLTKQSGEEQQKHGLPHRNPWDLIAFLLLY